MATPVPSTADEQDRNQARLRLDANIIVEAGAGTGKTTLLTDRILFLVLGWGKPEPVSIEQVVALTFTEKAAGEIKLRLSERLIDIVASLSGEPAQSERVGQILHELRTLFKKSDDEILTRARHALENLDKAPIGTIHSFCAQLLRLYPVEAGIDPRFQIDQGDAFDEIFQAVWAVWLDVELGENPKRKNEWLDVLSKVNLDELQELARQLCLEKLELKHLGSIDHESAESLRVLFNRVQALPQGRPKPRGKIIESIGEIALTLEATANQIKGNRKVEQNREPLLPVRKSSWPTSWGDDEEAEQLYLQGQDIASKISPSNELIIAAAVRLVLPLIDQFKREYMRRGWVSFDGLLRRARDLVRDQFRVREELKARYQALLIDEFQDTDPLQGELLLFLAEEVGQKATHWSNIIPSKGKIFIVGDPKQSIYRFRGADIAAYQDFVSHLEKNGALNCSLTTNFRSVPSLIEVVNKTFSQVMIGKRAIQADYRDITWARSETSVEKSVQSVFIDGENDSAQGQRAQALWISNWIVQHCLENKSHKRYELKDVAVLLRSSSFLPSLLEAFKNAGIAYAVEIERFFYDAPEINDFINLLRVLDNPQDQIALIGLLRSPLAIISDDGILALSRAKALDDRKDLKTNVLTSAEHRRVMSLFQTLRHLRLKVGRLPLSDLLYAAYKETHFMELAARAYHGQQTVSNLLKLQRLALEACDGRGATLKEFASRVLESSRESRREGESPLADEHLQAVRVMTMHKSKGLEFPVVFLANLSGRLAGQVDKPSVRQLSNSRLALRVGGNTSAAMALADTQEKILEQNESIRLLYVAMTRAKDQLFLLGRRKIEASSLCAHLRKAGQWPQEAITTNNASTSIIPQEITALTISTNQKPIFNEKEIEQSIVHWHKRQSMFKEENIPLTLSASEYLQKQKPLLAQRDNKPSEVTAGSLIGQICHFVLQSWDYTSPGAVEVSVSHAKSVLEKKQQSPHWLLAQNESVRILKAFFSSQTGLKLAKMEILAREMPFAYLEKSTIIHGAIDLLCKSKEDLFVVDYKSEHVDAASVQKVREHYQEQGRIYCEAVLRSWGKKPHFRIIFLRSPHLSDL